LDPVDRIVTSIRWLVGELGIRDDQRERETNQSNALLAKKLDLEERSTVGDVLQEMHRTLQQIFAFDLGSDRESRSVVDFDRNKRQKLGLIEACCGLF